MRKFFICIMFAVTTMVNAQEIDSLFVNMPDSLFPYLSHEKRVELLNIDKITSDTPTSLPTMYNGTAKLLLHDKECIKIALDSLSSVELGLQKSDGNAVCCVLRTVAAPERNTMASLYSDKLEKIKDINLEAVTLTHRPDTMTTERYKELLKLIEFRLIEAHFENVSTIVLKQNVPLVSEKERKDLAAILLQRKMKWNGREYVCE